MKLIFKHIVFNENVWIWKKKSLPRLEGLVHHVINAKKVNSGPENGLASRGHQAISWLLHLVITGITSSGRLMAWPSGPVIPNTTLEGVLWWREADLSIYLSICYHALRINNKVPSPPLAPPLQTGLMVGLRGWWILCLRFSFKTLRHACKQLV